LQFRFGDHSLDTDRCELRRRGMLVALEPQVFDLLVYLVQNRDRVVSKDDLLEAVWGGRIVSESALTSRITAVRKAIGDDGGAQRFIRILPRKGFRFIGLVEEVERRVTPSDTPVTATEGPTRPGLALPEKPSIAVLPFANMSGDPDQQFFADGMVEEIITALSRIRWLFVIARNSSFTYKGRAVDVKEVGRDLNVRYVLEGSVRKAGQRVRISAQLIEAASGAHLWADRFDGSLEDVFELQDKVAINVAGVIEPALQLAKRHARRSVRLTTLWPTTFICVPIRCFSRRRGKSLALCSCSSRRSSVIRAVDRHSPAPRSTVCDSAWMVAVSIWKRTAAGVWISLGDHSRLPATTRASSPTPPWRWRSSARTRRDDDPGRSRTLPQSELRPRLSTSALV
jgi:TolB-like protein